MKDQTQNSFWAVALGILLFTAQAGADTEVRVDILPTTIKVVSSMVGSGFAVHGTDGSAVQIICTQQYFPMTGKLSVLLQQKEENGGEDSKIRLVQSLPSYDDCRIELTKVFERVKNGAQVLIVKSSANALTFAEVDPK